MLAIHWMAGFCVYRYTVTLEEHVDGVSNRTNRLYIVYYKQALP